MVSFTVKGDLKKTTNFLERVKGSLNLSCLDKYGKEGVKILEKATPLDSGSTSNSWYYEIVRNKNSVSIYWCNSNVDKQGTPIAVLLQYGHGTRNGGYVEGKDYINPAIRPIFDRLAEDAWKEVNNL